MNGLPEGACRAARSPLERRLTVLLPAWAVGKALEPLWEDWLDGAGGWLLQGRPLDDLLGFPPQGPLPWAALARRGLGLHGRGHWLLGTPLHLSPKGTGLDWEVAAPEAGEMEALAADVNRHFGAWGWRLEPAPGAAVWFLGFDAPTGLRTRPPFHPGRGDAPWLPDGEEAAGWRVRLNELQMFLHEHPVNRAREEAGRPPVNGLWPWGEGTLAPGQGRPWAAVGGDDPVLGGLAALAGRPCLSPRELLGRIAGTGAAGGGDYLLGWGAPLWAAGTARPEAVAGELLPGLEAALGGLDRLVLCSTSGTGYYLMVRHGPARVLKRWWRSIRSR